MRLWQKKNRYSHTYRQKRDKVEVVQLCNVYILYVRWVQHWKALTQVSLRGVMRAHYQIINTPLYTQCIWAYLYTRKKHTFTFKRPTSCSIYSHTTKSSGIYIYKQKCFFAVFRHFDFFFSSNWLLLRWWLFCYCAQP